MKELHEKKISELIPEDIWYNGKETKLPVEILKDLREWAIAVVKEIGNLNNHNCVSFPMHEVGFRYTCSECESIKDFLRRRFEIKPEEL
jgi:hypothetical protein